MVLQTINHLELDPQSQKLKDDHEPLHHYLWSNALDDWSDSKPLSTPYRVFVMKPKLEYISRDICELFIDRDCERMASRINGVKSSSKTWKSEVVLSLNTDFARFRITYIKALEILKRKKKSIEKRNKLKTICTNVSASFDHKGWGSYAKITATFSESTPNRL